MAKTLGDLLAEASTLGQHGKVKRAVRAIVREARAVKHAATSRGHARGRGQSSKGKGRDACLQVQALLLKAFPHLDEDDVLVKATSMAGVDLHLSPRALDCFPFAIESKNVEALNIWAALKQAEIIADKRQRSPIVFFKRAHSPHYVALRAVTFLLMAQDAHKRRTEILAERHPEGV